MDTELSQKFPFILDRNLAKANCTGNRVCTPCDTVVLGRKIYNRDGFTTFVPIHDENEKKNEKLKMFIFKHTGVFT